MAEACRGADPFPSPYAGPLGELVREIDAIVAREAPATPGRKRIYVASSWRNAMQQGVVHLLRAAGHEVYDFRNPAPGDTGFSWRDVEPGWKDWDVETYVALLDHPVAAAGYANDWNAMLAADVGVLVLPSGRSAHIEAGYFVGAGKPLYILLLDKQEPELMYKMATRICTSTDELLAAIGLNRPDLADEPPPPAAPSPEPVALAS